MQSFLAFFYLLDKCFEKYPEDNFGALLGTISPELWKDGKPMNFAVCNDWYRLNQRVNPEYIIDASCFFLEYYETQYGYQFSETRKLLREFVNAEMVTNAYQYARQMWNKHHYDISFFEADLMLGNNAPFLVSLNDSFDNELRIVITAACVEEQRPIVECSGINSQTACTLQSILENAKSVIPDNGLQYEIVFSNYIMFQNRNESYCSFDPNEARQGKYLITFQESKLLSYVREITDIQILPDGSCYPGEWFHYGIYTQNHIIDVISHNAPQIFYQPGDKKKL